MKGGWLSECEFEICKTLAISENVQGKCGGHTLSLIRSCSPIPAFCLYLLKNTLVPLPNTSNPSLLDSESSAPPSPSPSKTA